MEVQTYFIEETKALVTDDQQLDEWKSLINDLGVEGQATLTYEEGSPIPFKYMNHALRQTIETLCERSEDYKKFNKEPIPLEVLKLISLSEREHYFQQIKICYADKDPDPVCIGFAGHWEESMWYENSNKQLKELKFETEKEAIESGAKHPRFEEVGRYLIARWGDEKLQIQELIKLAKEKWIKKESIQQEKAIREARRAIEDIESNAFDKFGV